MRILFIVAALFILAGCKTMDFTSVTLSSGHHYPSNHISYTLGFYSGHHYNGYTVYGDYGYRYYYAPRHYTNHHYYSAPVVHHYVAPRPHHYVAPRPHYVQPRNHNNHQNRTRTVVRNENRHDNADRRENRQERRRDQKRKRK